MNQMHIRNVDLNLISVFDAIMAEGNLGAAGERLGLSQSAVSHALARLRAITGDELFVRTRKGMRPTPHAVALAGPLQSAVELCRQAFAKRNGVPTLATERTFVIDLPVGFDVVFVPRICATARPNWRSTSNRPKPNGYAARRSMRTRSWSAPGKGASIRSAS
jgi:DNA-binding transcriptional LysR family regulator